VERALTTAWFDEQSRMSPEDLLTVTFPAARRGRRGYDEDSVREFLSLVHGEHLRVLNERTSLWQELQRLRRRIIAGQVQGGDSNGALSGDSEGHVQAVRILSAAQLTADRYVADAQAYSSRLTEEARLRRDEIMQDAQHYSDMVLEDAHAKARVAVSALNAAPSPQTYQQQQAARAELAYLRTYSDVYRAHLRAYTEGILRGMEDWERKESAFGTEVPGPALAELPMPDGNSYHH
jgi:DivIVA domain-containing protein